MDRINRRVRSTGFTLAELLVVIGIIALLISILLPSLGRARQHAQAVHCSNNLRQIAMAASVYADVNRNFYPPAHYLDPAATPPNSVGGAHILLKDYMGGTSDAILCPAQPQAIDLRALYSSLYKISDELPQYTSYQFNYYVFVNALTNPSARPTNRSVLRGPTDLILLYDGAVGLGKGGPWEVIQARHPGPTFNAVFLDCHVEPIGAHARGTAPGVGGLIPTYLVDRGNRPIYYAGADVIPYRTGGASQGQPAPGFGAIVWGQVDWRE